MSSPATTTPFTNNRDSLVSSFYGPGTTICWYLTTLSVFVSWLLHPRKRESGSVDNDLITVVTFPLVAASHMIYQIKAYPGSRTEIFTSPDPYLQMKADAIEASLNITESALPISAALVLIAIWYKNVKRALMLTLTGVFCLGAECFLFISSPSLSNSKGSLSRSFLVNFAETWTAILVLVAFLLLVTLGLVFIFVLKNDFSAFFDPRFQNARIDTERLPGEEEMVLEFKSSIESLRLSVLSMVLLPLCFVLSAVQSVVAFSDIISLSYEISNSSMSRIRVIFTQLAEYIIPRSNNSVAELDQSVAIFAGITVLGFSIYSVAHARYRDRRAKNLQQDGGIIEMDNLARDFRGGRERQSFPNESRDRRRQSI